MRIYFKYNILKYTLSDPYLSAKRVTYIYIYDPWTVNCGAIKLVSAIYVGWFIV